MIIYQQNPTVSLRNSVSTSLYLSTKDLNTNGNTGNFRKKTKKIKTFGGNFRIRTKSHTIISPRKAKGGEIGQREEAQNLSGTALLRQTPLMLPIE